MRGTQHKETGLNLSPKVSALYKAGDFNLRASYAMGFKAPTIKELYYEYTGSISGGSLTAYHGNTGLKGANLTIRFRQRGIRGEQVPGEPDRLRQLHPQHDRAGRDKKSPPNEKLLEIEKSKRYTNLTKARIYGMDFTFNYRPVKDIHAGRRVQLCRSESAVCRR